MTDRVKITDKYVTSCWERRVPLRQRKTSLETILRNAEEELESVDRQLELLQEVEEFYDGVPLATSSIMGTMYSTVSDETERYGRVSDTIHGQFHAIIGDDPFGAKGERTVAWYLDDFDEAAEIVKRWVVYGEEPPKT